ncbi:choline/ethanolamine kinase isoform X2 [Toxorhynchites rutilus septentrionalis]|uniref:choline/ethanolamine kinase isoform X2 n=1 Tax=Toxorhynchites rutilus septentrionalis TaxID=329112 RepID=UPI0024787BC7|nr:choline/ethanolamine kinase isoform X2 [Toxorhynchites rutilus septentrionalis]
MDRMQVVASKTPTEMRDVAARICRDYLTGAWKTIPADQLQLKRISGGLSNFLYYVSLPDNHDSGSAKPAFNGNNSKRPRKGSCPNIHQPKEVLLRIYGQTHGEHALETMLTESVVFTLLSERKLGPKLHGIFPGGRIEQYIPARALLTAELSDTKISTRIAEKMAAIHSLDIPVSKEPDWLWNTMNRWLKSAETTLKTLEGKRTGKNCDDIITRLDLRAEVDWLKSIIVNDEHPVVFSHNDLQEGNILLMEDFPASNVVDSYCTLDQFDESAQLGSHFRSILISNSTDRNSDPHSCNTNGSFAARNDHESGDVDCNKNPRKRLLDDNIENEFDNTRDSVLSGNSQAISDQPSEGEPELMIIDFEYCAYNYRGFDIANHFLEWTFDYTNSRSPYFHHQPERYPSVEQQEKFIETYLTKSSCVEEPCPSAADVAEVQREVRCFTLASHLFWSLWAIVNMYQEIEFGYREYAICRLNQYEISKNIYSEFTINTKHAPVTNSEK